MSTYATSPHPAGGAASRLAISCFIFFLPLTAPAHGFADTEAAPGTIKLYGLTFSCAKCAIENGRCLVPGGREAQSVEECEALALSLLRRRLATGYDGTRPEISELRSAVLRGGLPPDIALATLRLLAHTEEGNQVLSQNALRLIPQYSSALEQIFSEGAGTPQMLLSYWQALTGEGIQGNMALKAAIVAKQPALPSSQLYEQLAAADAERDLVDLADILRVFQALNDSRKDEVQVLRGVVQECAKIPAERVVPDGCSVGRIGSLPASARPYVERLQANLIIGACEKAPAIEKLNLLAQSSYVRHRTPSMHRLLLSALKELSGVDSAHLAIRVTDEIAQMIRTFAEHDDVVRQQAAFFFVVAADSASAGGRLIEAYTLLNHSVALAPIEMPSRSAVFAKLRRQAAAASDGVLVSNVDKLRAQEKFTRSKKTLIGVVMLILGIGGTLIWLYFLRSKLLAKVIMEESALTAEERETLRELFNYFDLPPTASEEELTKEFRRRAKELHPDTGFGTVEQFALLSDRYQKIKEILAKKGVRERDV